LIFSAQKQQILLIIKHTATDINIQKPAINKHPEITFKKTKIYCHNPISVILISKIFHGDVDAGGRRRLEVD